MNGSPLCGLIGAGIQPLSPACSRTRRASTAFASTQLIDLDASSRGGCSAHAHRRGAPHVLRRLNIRYPCKQPVIHMTRCPTSRGHRRRQHRGRGDRLVGHNTDGSAGAGASGAHCRGPTSRAWSCSAPAGRARPVRTRCCGSAPRGSSSSTRTRRARRRWRHGSTHTWAAGARAPAPTSARHCRAPAASSTRRRRGWRPCPVCRCTKTGCGPRVVSRCLAPGTALLKTARRVGRDGRWRPHERGSGHRRLKLFTGRRRRGAVDAHFRRLVRDERRPRDAIPASTPGRGRHRSSVRHLAAGTSARCCSRWASRWPAIARGGRVPSGRMNVM